MDKLAINGMYQHSMQKDAHCRLLRVSICCRTAIYIRKSAAVSTAFTVRFLEWSTLDSRAVQTGPRRALSAQYLLAREPRKRIYQWCIGWQQLSFVQFAQHPPSEVPVLPGHQARRPNRLPERTPDSTVRSGYSCDKLMNGSADGYFNAELFTQLAPQAHRQQTRQHRSCHPGTPTDH